MASWEGIGEPPHSEGETSYQVEGKVALTRSAVRRRALNSETPFSPEHPLQNISSLSRSKMSPLPPGQSSVWSHGKSPYLATQISTHTKILLSWETDADRGSMATRGPVLYALERIPEKLATVTGISQSPNLLSSILTILLP